MSHMQIETIETNWIIIDSMNGMEYFDSVYFSIMEAIEQVGFDSIYSIETQYGWSARYSAKGYLDCTDFIGVFPEEFMAIEHLKEVYGEQDND